MVTNHGLFLKSTTNTEKSSIVKGSVSSEIVSRRSKSQLGKLRKTISDYLQGTTQIIERYSNF